MTCFMKKSMFFIFLICVTSMYSQKNIVFPNNISTFGSTTDNGALNAAANENFTITAWVKTNNTTNQLFLCKRLNGAGAGYELWQLNGYLAINCTHTNGSSSGVPGGSKYKINDGKWHQIAFVIDVSNAKYNLYVDGKLDITKTLVSTSGVTNTQPLLFGIRGNNTLPMSGAMDEVRIYKKALTPAELIADMALNVNATTANLSAGWNFEEGSGNTAADIKTACPVSFTGTPGWGSVETLTPQTLTMNQPINLSFGSADFSPATSSSSMPIEYSTSDPNIAVAMDGKIHITGKGSCTITANQPSNLFYAAANPVTQTLNVLKTVITLNTPFTDHAVIQRDQPIILSGTADINDTLTINLDGEIKTTIVDANGNWNCTFSPKSAKSTSFTLVAEGNNSQKTTLSDLVCGDVWIASGQSNMWMSIGGNITPILNSSTEIAAAMFPNIRFIQPIDIWQQASTPQQSIKTANNGWTVCSPTTAGGFSAVAYFFAQKIHADQNIPVGIIQSAVGGTRIEAWTPLEGLNSIPEYSSWYTKATTTTLESGQTYNRKNFPAANYNGMLAPYSKAAVKGIIWYQGEENFAIDGLSGISTYGNKFKATINAWRSIWNNPELPVIYAEIANYKYSTVYAVLNSSREALPMFINEQRKATTLNNVYGVTLSDISNYNDIHPTDKAPVGTRMGNAALGFVYGKTSIVPVAATFKEMKSEGSALRVIFNHNEGFHLSTGTTINEFKIAGADKVFKNATAVLSGNDILVSEPTISQPLYVKYAWDENSNPNLFNGSNSPTARFNESLDVIQSVSDTKHSHIKLEINNKQITISGMNDESKIEIIGLTGSIFYSSLSSAEKIMLPSKNLSGIYILSIRDNNGQYFYKFSI